MLAAPSCLRACQVAQQIILVRTCTVKAASTVHPEVVRNSAGIKYLMSEIIESLIESSAVHPHRHIDLVGKLSYATVCHVENISFVQITISERTQKQDIPAKWLTIS